jgi:hypothetical protein
MSLKKNKSEKNANDTDTDTAHPQAAEPNAAGSAPARAAAPAAAQEVHRREPAPAPAVAPDRAAAALERAPAADGAPGARRAPAAPDPALAALFSGASPGDDVGRLGATEKVALDGFDVAGLLALRSQIDARLPPRTLESVDLVQELLLQYQLAKDLMARTMSSLGVPANQQAQVVNSCTAVLKQVSETQTALYTTERVKMIEQAVEKAMQGAPIAVKEAFIERYAALLADAAQRKQDKKTQ